MVQGREREEGAGEIFTLELRRERSGSAETLLPGPEAATSPPEAGTSGSSFLQEVTRWDQCCTVLYCTVLYCRWDQRSVYQRSWSRKGRNRDRDTTAVRKLSL